MLPFQTENGSIGNFPQSIYRLLIVKFINCPFVDEEANRRSCSFANGLNVINGFAHLCVLVHNSVETALVGRSVRFGSIVHEFFN